MVVSSKCRKALMLLMLLALALSAGCKPEGERVLDPQTGALVSPVYTPPPMLTRVPTLISPLPTPFPTPWPPDFTPSPTPLPSPTPEGVPYIITDPVNHFSLTLLPDWNAHVGGTTVIFNYDDEKFGSEGNFPPHGLKIQISVGYLESKQSFEQWLASFCPKSG
jgi:hypothetical protein